MVYSIKGDILKGAIIKNNTRLENCYVVKNDKYFSHGKTLKEAYKSLEAKVIRNLPIKDLITKFKDKFPFLTIKYKAKDLFDWHFNLTGSCEYGRILFIKNRDINLKKDKFTIKEFIELTINEYGGDVIRQLKTYIKLSS
jgi:hypothetical protein